MAKNILIVDRTSFNRATIKNILNKAGYNVVAEAENGRRAIDAYKAHRPDLVIMDIQLPEMDGIETLKAMNNVPVIICSATGQQMMVLEALKAGARDFLVKPVQPDRLIESVKKCIG